jgi:hypothetical protein
MFPNEKKYFESLNLLCGRYVHHAQHGCGVVVAVDLIRHRRKVKFERCNVRLPHQVTPEEQARNRFDLDERTLYVSWWIVSELWLPLDSLKEQKNAHLISTDRDAVEEQMYLDLLHRDEKSRSSDRW